MKTRICDLGGKTTMRSRAVILAVMIGLLELVAGVVVGAAQEPDTGAKRRPNILWIVGENFDLDFGCFGARNVSTPNVDSLAAVGVRYTRVLSTSPVCAPAALPS